MKDGNLFSLFNREDPVKKKVISPAPAKTVEARQRYLEENDDLEPGLARDVIESPYIAPPPRQAHDFPPLPPLNPDLGVPTVRYYRNDGLMYKCRACGAYNIGIGVMNWSGERGYDITFCIACGSTKTHQIWTGDLPPGAEACPASRAWRDYWK